MGDSLNMTATNNYHPIVWNRSALSSSRCNANYSKEIYIFEVGPFRFIKPLLFQTEISGDIIILSNKESDLIASGCTIEEAKKDLQSEIETAWNEYALEDDCKMDGVAREYKKWLLNNIQRRD